jgi:lipopolysaccharide/colanic/teichoic acid biosynthesis glycosyltransferase
MSNKKDENGNLLPDHLRLSEFGLKLRSTSLDELPSLINVLKGDMSLIGPRPFISEYLPLYNNHQKRRHLVKPGITGWAQINGRNALSWAERFDLDIWYVENISFWLDIKILFRTFVKVTKSEDISPTDAVTMEPFKGNN